MALHRLRCAIADAPSARARRKKATRRELATLRNGWRFWLTTKGSWPHAWRHEEEYGDDLGCMTMRQRWCIAFVATGGTILKLRRWCNFTDTAGETEMLFVDECLRRHPFEASYQYDGDGDSWHVSLSTLLARHIKFAQDLSRALATYDHAAFRDLVPLARQREIIRELQDDEVADLVQEVAAARAAASRALHHQRWSRICTRAPGFISFSLT